MSCIKLHLYFRECSPRSYIGLLAGHHQHSDTPSCAVKLMLSRYSFAALTLQNGIKAYYSQGPITVLQ